MGEKKLYRYEGPVTSFGSIINDNWKGGTFAETEKRAKSNLMFQYKKKSKPQMDVSAKIELPGKLYVIE